MNKLIPISLLVVVMAGAGWMYYRNQAAEKAAALADAPEYGEVTRQEILQNVECTGRVVSNLDVEIKCKASGQIIGLPFDVSDQVKKGDLLLEIDPVDQARNLQQVEATVAASNARLAQARANLAASEKSLTAEMARAAAALASANARAQDAEAKAKRDASLLEQKHVSVEEAESSRTNAVEARANVGTAQAQLASVEAQREQLEADRQAVRLAEVQITSDEAALALARQRLAETKVAAPIDGVVSARLVQIGQIVSSGISNVGGGTSVMTVSDISRMFILASVDESDIGEVREGHKSKITVDAFPGEEFTGTVVRIASKGTNVSNVVTFEVKIEVESDNKALLKPEMTANVSISVAAAENALTAPIRAISRKGKDGFITVVTGEGPEEKQEQVPVKTGINDGVRIELTEGGKEGDRVLLVRSDDESRWRNQSNPRPPALFGGSSRTR